MLGMFGSDLVKACASEGNEDSVLSVSRTSFQGSIWYYTHIRRNERYRPWIIPPSSHSRVRSLALCQSINLGTVVQRKRNRDLVPAGSG